MPKLNLNHIHVSDAVRRLNPELFGLGRLPTAVAQQSPARSLVGQTQGAQEGSGGVALGRRTRSAHGPRLRIALVAFRRTGRELDHDNLVGGLKWLRDSIAEWIGIDDSERNIDWTYSQHPTRGREGVSVRIETT
jgi:hypothetical protein